MLAPEPPVQGSTAIGYDRVELPGSPLAASPSDTPSGSTRPGALVSPPMPAPGPPAQANEVTGYGTDEL
eukprot:14594405-Alexandrium_andersonii.AAC.1